MKRFLGWGRLRFRSGLLLGAAAVSLSACANVPKLGSEPEPRPAESYAASKSFAGPTAEWPSDAWWRAYGDAQLNTLIDDALTGSPDLAVAQARVRRAEALAQQAGAALKPQVSVEAAVGGARQSYNTGLPEGAVPEGWNDVGRIGVDFSLNLDLFGRNRALLAAATSEAEAARADAAAARLVLSTAVATAYADLNRVYADREAVEEALRIRLDSERLITLRFEHGLETRAAVERAHSARAGAEAELAALDEAGGLLRNGIAALLGQGPDRGLEIVRPTPGAIRAFGLPENLQADLIGRRPDVVAARLTAEAARQRIKAAKASFYPNVNLAAFIGLESLGLDMLLNADSTVGQVGPAISLPIFSGGRLKGAYRGARAGYDGAVASYDQTLTQALKEVADAAVSTRALDGRLAKTREAYAASETAHGLLRKRYAQGLATYLDVLTAEDALVSSRRAAAALESRAVALDVALIRALGGGYRA